MSVLQWDPARVALATMCMLAGEQSNTERLQAMEGKGTPAMAVFDVGRA